MNSIITALCTGELDLTTDAFIQNPRYLEALNDFTRAKEAVHSTLDREQKRNFLRLMDAHSLILELLLSESLALGFRVGGGLVSELCLSSRYTSP